MISQKIVWHFLVLVWWSDALSSRSSSLIVRHILMFNDNSCFMFVRVACAPLFFDQIHLFSFLSWEEEDGCYWSVYLPLVQTWTQSFSILVMTCGVVDKKRGRIWCWYVIEGSLWKTEKRIKNILNDKLIRNKRDCVRWPNSSLTSEFWYSIETWIMACRVNIPWCVIDWHV